MPYQSQWEQESITRDEVNKLEGATLIEFGAEWCPHCQAVQSKLKEVLSDSTVRHLKIEDGRGRPLGRSFKVKLWPNFVLLRDGEVIEQQARPSEDELAQLLTKL